LFARYAIAAASFAAPNERIDVDGKPDAKARDQDDLIDRTNHFFFRAFIFGIDVC